MKMMEIMKTSVSLLAILLLTVCLTFWLLVQLVIAIVLRVIISFVFKKKHLLVPCLFGLLALCFESLCHWVMYHCLV